MAKAQVGASMEDTVALIFCSWKIEVNLHNISCPGSTTICESANQEGFSARNDLVMSKYNVNCKGFYQYANMS